MTLSLVTVGTGTVAPSATRGSPAHWVERDGLRLLLDCGPGTMHRLARFGLIDIHCQSDMHIRQVGIGLPIATRHPAAANQGNSQGGVCGHTCSPPA